MSDEEVKEVSEEPKPTKRPKKKSEPKMSIQQFFKRSGSKLTKYEQAYVATRYVGTMKTQSEWESELSSLGF